MLNGELFIDKDLSSTAKEDVEVDKELFVVGCIAFALISVKLFFGSIFESLVVLEVIDVEVEEMDSVSLDNVVIDDDVSELLVIVETAEVDKVVDELVISKDVLEVLKASKVVLEMSVVSRDVLELLVVRRDVLELLVVSEDVLDKVVAREVAEVVVELSAAAKLANIISTKYLLFMFEVSVVVGQK